MAVQLYKTGNTHEINGITCEMQVFDEYSYKPMLKVGWYMTPEKLRIAELELEKEKISEENASLIAEKARLDKIEAAASKIKKQCTKRKNSS